jgi:anti-anti-sigma regulatory factor
MQPTIRRWLDDLPLSNPLQRRQAGLLQIILLIIVGGCVIGMLISLLTTAMSITLVVSITVYILLIICMIGALIVLRSGRFTPAVALAIGGVIIPIGISLVTSGFTNAAGTLMSFTLPVTMAGLLLGRRGLLLVTAAEVAIVVIAALVQAGAPSLIGFIPVPPPTAATLTPIFILLIVVLSLFLDRFGTSLRNALTTTQAREQELETLRASLESTIAERTTSLQQALAAGEQRETRLALTLEDLRASQEAFRQLSAPVIPVLRGVLVAPLIGVLDSARATELTSNVLAMVEHEHAHHVIFDITGVPLVDTHVAQVLIQTTLAVRLLGAQALLVGIRPEVAQTMVALNLDMGALRSYSTLRDAIGALLAPRGDQDLRVAVLAHD